MIGFKPTFKKNIYCIERSELRASEALKEGRSARLYQKTSENDRFRVKEGFLYGT